MTIQANNAPRMNLSVSAPKIMVDTMNTYTRDEIDAKFAVINHTHETYESGIRELNSQFATVSSQLMSLVNTVDELPTKAYVDTAIQTSIDDLWGTAL